MNELIKVNYDNPERPVVSGRELHEALQIDTPYKKWFDRMTDYGFIENKDFWTNLSESTGGRPATDHMLTIPMAKELCMIQRTDTGRKFRQYFISIEEAWNSPEMVMQRALQFANRQLEIFKAKNSALEVTVTAQAQEISEMKPKVSYYDIVLNCKDLLSTTQIAKDYGKSAMWLNDFLYKKHIQFKKRKCWFLYQKYAEQGYTGTRTLTIDGADGFLHAKVHTGRKREDFSCTTY